MQLRQFACVCMQGDKLRFVPLRIAVDLPSIASALRRWNLKRMLGANSGVHSLSTESRACNILMNHQKPYITVIDNLSYKLDLSWSARRSWAIHLLVIVDIAFQARHDAQRALSHLVLVNEPTQPSTKYKD